MHDSKEYHDKRLEELVNNLHKIGENVEGIAWLFTDGNFYKPNKLSQYPLCDIVAGYYDYSVLLAELKRCSKSRDKAVKQLDSGENLINEMFPSYYVDSKKIVYYGNGDFTYENIR